jgi:hypothetical protein
MMTFSFSSISSITSSSSLINTTFSILDFVHDISREPHSLSYNCSSSWLSLSRHITSHTWCSVEKVMLITTGGRPRPTL